MRVAFHASAPVSTPPKVDNKHTFEQSRAHVRLLFLRSFCLVTDRPDIPYASASGAIRSTHGGQTWEKLPTYLNSSTDLPCEFDSSTVQQSAQVDTTSLVVIKQQAGQWNNFGLTANGTPYHLLDQGETRQGVTIPEGVALLISTGWTQTAPYPPLPKTVAAMAVLNVIVFTPASGASFVLAYRAQDIYL